MNTIASELQNYNQTVTISDFTIDDALARVSEGIFAIHPLHDTATGQCSCRDGAVCRSSGKHPRLSGYKSLAATDPQTVMRVWTQYPHANVGGVIKPGYVVLDNDPRHGGDIALAELEAQHGPRPLTLRANTAGGGTHDIYRLPIGFVVGSETKMVAGHGLELLLPGHNLVLPGSCVNGRYYHYADGLSPDEVEIADLPDYLLTFLVQPVAEVSAEPTKKTVTRRRDNRKFHEGERNDGLTSVAGKLLNRGYRDEALIEATLVANNTQCLPPLSTSEAQGIAISMQHTHDTKPQNDEWGMRNRAVILDVLSDALTKRWTGKTGASEFAILFAILAIAHAAKNLTVEISRRQIAEMACLTLATANARISALIRDGWLGIHATHTHRLAHLIASNADPETIANAATVYTIIPREGCRTNRTYVPPPSLMFYLCGMDALRVRGLGMSVVKLLAVMSGRVFPSARAVATAANMTPDTVERKLKKMQLIGLVMWTEEGIKLVDLSILGDDNFETAAKTLGTHGAGERQRKLHDRQRTEHKRYWGVETPEGQERRVVEREEREREGWGMYRLDSRATERKLKPMEKKAKSVPVDPIVRAVLNVFDGAEVVDLSSFDRRKTGVRQGYEQMRHAASYRLYRHKSAQKTGRGNEVRG